MVFVEGRAASADLKKWAGDLARNTQDVVAVVNRMDVNKPAAWDLTPAWIGLSALWYDFLRSIPLLLVGLFILALSVGAGLFTSRGVRALLRPRIQTRLLRNVLALAAGGLVVISGTYVVLRVVGLTQLALTVVGGTGLVGLVLGIAFRDITENFLASIFLSVQRPFEMADLIEVCGVTGYVQQLNTRTTVLMALDGNLVQIPNASIYKSNLRNFTTNANRRDDFVVGIGYDDSINDAQEVVLQVLAKHPAILRDPEPLVLADCLGKATVNLRVYFWLDGRKHSWLKVRSSVIRLVKRTLQENGISMPDEAREVVFPQGVPVIAVTDRGGEAAGAGSAHPERRPHSDPEAVSTEAEAGLSSERSTLEEQARHAKPLNEGENLLVSSSDVPSRADSFSSRSKS